MKSTLLFAIIISLLATACNGIIEVGMEHAPSGIPSLAATAIIAPTQTEALPSPAATVPQPSPTIQAPTQNKVKIFLIAMGDAGQTGTPVGCGDSAVPVEVEIQPTQGILKAALTTLLSIKNPYYGQSGLYHALYQSDLQVESASINGGKASVYLTGNLSMGGECDTPRVQAQLEQTVLQFPNVTEADIFINGKPLAEALSLKGTVPQPSPTSPAPTVNMVKIFLIAVDDNGKTGSPVGCGDSVVPVTVEVPPTQGVLKAALVALLSDKDQFYGQSGLYNALYQSDLQVESLSIEGSKASVNLSGTLLMGGECDTPRVQAQLEQTVLQFPTITEVDIFINGRPLAEVLSLKG
jgi:hypothetical protein